MPTGILTFIKNFFAGGTFTGVISLFASNYGTITDNGNSGTSKTIDWSIKNIQKVTLTGDVAFTFTAPGGCTHLSLLMIEDGTGGHTPTWPGTVAWTEGSAPTSMTLNKKRVVTFLYDGSTYYGQFSSGF